MVVEIPKDKNAIDWKDLHIPSVWASQFYVIAERLKNIKDKYLKEGKRGEDYMEATIKQFNELVLKMEDAYKPKPPRTIEDAHKYALSRKYKGTFAALLDADGNLVKTVIVKRGEILPVFPEYKIEDSEIEVKMTQHLLKIPELEFERSVPKRVAKVVPFGSDKEKITGYGD